MRHHNQVEIPASELWLFQNKEALENVEFNYSFGESMALTLPKWTNAEKICNILLSIPYKTSFSGDIYAKFAT